MTMMELCMRHEEEMNRMIEDCIFDLMRKMPIAHTALDVETMGLTIDELYELSNKFLPIRVLERYIAKEYRIAFARRTELVSFEVDEKGKPAMNGEKRTLKSTRIVYAWVDDDYFEEEEPDIEWEED